MASIKNLRFFVPCDCFEKISKKCAKKQHKLVGIQKLTKSLTESRLCTMAVSPIVGPDGQGYAEALFLNFCPFCGVLLMVEDPEQEKIDAELN